MLHLEYGFVWCWNLDASGSRSEIPGKFWNVVLEKDGEDQLDRSCEKWRSVTWVNEQRNILIDIRKRKANWIVHILRRNCLLKQVIEGKIKDRWMWQEDGEEDVRSYWMTLRTGEDTLIWKRRLWIALCRGIVLKEALDLSSDRLLNKIRCCIIRVPFLWNTSGCVFGAVPSGW